MMRAPETKDASGSSHYGIVPRRSDAPGARLRSGTRERANRLSIGTEELLAAIDLAKEIESTANRELRLSRAVVALGGHIGSHSADRFSRVSRARKTRKAPRQVSRRVSSEQIVEIERRHPRPDPARTAEIRDPRLGADPGAAERYGPARLLIR